MGFVVGFADLRKHRGEVRFDGVQCDDVVLRYLLLPGNKRSIAVRGGRGAGWEGVSWPGGASHGPAECEAWLCTVECPVVNDA